MNLFEERLTAWHPRLGEMGLPSILGRLLLFILAKNSSRAHGAIYNLESSLTLFIYSSRVYCSLTFLVIKSVHPRSYLVTNQL